MLAVRNLLCIWRSLLCLVLMTPSLFAAFEYQGIGWPAAGANIRVVGDNNLDRILTNPALLVRGRQPLRLNLQYSRPFTGLDLQGGCVSTLFSIKTVPLVGGLMYFGDEYYSEFNLSVGSRGPSLPGFSTGVVLNYYYLGVVGYESQQALTGSFSTSLVLTQDVRLGSAVEHVFQSGKSLLIPQQFLFGVDYDAGPIHLMIELEKEAALPLELCIGILSSPLQKWQIAFGYRNLSRTLSAGWRVQLQRFGAHYTCLFHPELPLSHGFGVEWIFP